MDPRTISRGVLLLVAVLAAAATGCESTTSPNIDTNNGTSGDVDGDGDGDTSGGDGDGDGDGDSDGDTDTGTGCESQDMPFEVTPVKVMVLEDYSSSMDGNKWTNGKNALLAVLNQWKGKQIEFGLDLFPDDGDCGVGYLQADTSPDAGVTDAIINWLDKQGANAPSGNTPMYAAMNNYTNTAWAPAFHDKTYPSYLMLISDGEETCGDGSEDYGALAATLRDQYGIKTFAVGFGGGAPVATLDAIASNGGTSITTYIPAKDTATLLDAFSKISGDIVGCSYDIDTSNPNVDPDKINFFFDGKTVPFNPDCNTTPPGPDVGWRWTDSTHTTVEFCSQTCQKLKDGEVTEVHAEFGCPSAVE
jgi:plastocyanin